MNCYKNYMLTFVFNAKSVRSPQTMDGQLASTAILLSVASADGASSTGSLIGERLPGLAELCANPDLRESFETAFPAIPPLRVFKPVPKNRAVPVVRPVAVALSAHGRLELSFAFPPQAPCRINHQFARPSDFIFRQRSEIGSAACGPHKRRLHHNRVLPYTTEPLQTSQPEAAQGPNGAAWAAAVDDDDENDIGVAPHVELGCFTPCTAKRTAVPCVRHLPVFQLRTDRVNGEFRSCYIHFACAPGLQHVNSSVLSVWLTIRNVKYEMTWTLIVGKVGPRIRVSLNDLLHMRPTVLGARQLPVVAKAEFVIDDTTVFCCHFVLECAFRSRQLTVGV
jgi:hypothetical protein